jgi:putative transposase
MKYRFIDREVQHYPVKWLCRVMGVSRSGYYAWKAGGVKVIAEPERALRRRLKALFRRSRESLGSRRLSHQLREEGYPLGRYRVRRLMREMGLHVRTKRRFKLTTDSRHRLPVADNVLNRSFKPNFESLGGVSDYIGINYVPNA